MNRYFLGLILLLGFLLRTVLIDKVPAGFTPDEASFGYDAYSIIKTGSDQWGKAYPVVFKSFGDYKSPLYTYLTIPSVAIFGLNVFSVRLTNAIIGTLAVYLTYLLTALLVKNLQNSVRLNDKSAGITAAFLLAVSPWHIMMSRGAFEANITTLLLTSSLYFFLKGLKDSKYIIASVVFASLNLFSYHSAKFVTPVVLLVAAFVYKKEFFRFEKYRIISVLIGTVFFIIFVSSVFGGSSTRIMNTSIMGRALLEASDERIKAINMGMNPILARVVYNKYQAGLRRFSLNYLSYFSPQFLFTNGPAEATYGMIPGRGVLYWADGILLLSFIVFLVKNYRSKILWILVAWLFASAIPAALSIGPGYAANRAETMIPVLQIILAIGLLYIYQLLFGLKYKKLIISSYLILYFGFILYFGLEYFLLSPLKNSRSMLWGSLKAAQYTVQNYPNKDILVSRSLSEPHIYFAFASRYDPHLYQNESVSWDLNKEGLDWVDQLPEYKLGRFYFTGISKEKLDSKKYNVVVGKPEEFDNKIVPTKIINYPDGTEAVYILEI